MARLSNYLIAFSCITCSANLCANDYHGDEKRVEEAIQETKRTDQTIESKNVESDLQERKREEQRIERKREEERRRDRSDNDENSKQFIADRDKKKSKEDDDDSPRSSKREKREERQSKKEKQVEFQQQPKQERQVQFQQQPKQEKQVQFQQQPKQEKQVQFQKQPKEEKVFQFRKPKEEKEVQLQKQPRDEKGAIQPITKERFSKKAEEWTKKGKKDRDAFKDFRSKKHVFDRDYWNRYHSRHNHWRFKNDFNWWVVVSYPGLTDWLNIRPVRPRYYYYGDDGVIYYSDSSSYNNFIEVQGYNDFLNQAVLLARSIPQIDPQNVRWMPLGVFALSPVYGLDDTPNDYFTLAVSPEGVIGGVYFNPDTNQNAEIEGIVDSQSLRAVWKFIGSDWPIFETGVLNFTQEESTAFIHYPQGRREAQLLIRLQE